jgi:hypothetical protein
MTTTIIHIELTVEVSADCIRTKATRDEPGYVEFQDHRIFISDEVSGLQIELTDQQVKKLMDHYSDEVEDCLLDAEADNY